MNPITGYLLVFALLGTISAGFSGYMLGRKDCNDSWEARGDSTRIADLERELAQAMVADLAGEQLRARVVFEVADINVQTKTSIALVRAAWDRPACVLPVGVRQGIQGRVDQANTTAGGL